MKNKVTWGQFALKVLSLIETLLPAFLLAWNERLRQKAKRLENELSHVEHDLDVERSTTRIRGEFNGKTDRAIIDDFIGQGGNGNNTDGSGR